MPTIRSAVALLFLCGFAASPASATDYYVSSGGNDANAGTSAASPWLTLAPVNALALVPGDRVLLRAGDTFFGGLSFDAEDAGSPAAPIVITSYGAGRAAIYAGSGDGISVYNAAGYEISNLDLTGAGAWASGIVFYNDLPGGVKLGYIRIDGVDVSGFGRDGIEIGAWSGSSGFRDVRITNASAHGNARTGIIFYAQQPNTHEWAYIGFSRAFDNTGVIGATVNTGSGIVFGGVNGGTIERSVAHGNGRLCTAPEGPVGIWAYDSTAVVIQHNESYGNLTGGPADGDGFDLDQNVSSSVLQYNYSHDNAGAGYLLAQGPLNDNHRGNTVRYNISQNDGRANSYAAIEIWGRIVSAEVYGNTVYLSPAASGTPGAVRIGNASIGDRFVSGLHLRNNILETTGGLPIVEVTTGQLAGAGDLLIQGNDYWSAGATWSVLWGGTAYSSLAAWRATAQETAAGAATGFAVDPLLNAAGDGGTLDDAAKLETLGAYKLQSSSSLIDRGLNLAASFGVNIGTIDFFGATLPQAAGYDVGANEASGPVVTGGGSDEIVLYAFTATAIAGTWTRIPDATAAGGARIGNPDAGAAKLTGALANPANYFELAFDAEAGRPYRLWVRGRADGDYWGNDSVFVQFSGSVDAAGSPAWRIGSTSSTVVNLEDCSGCGVSGWGWQDNGYGAGVLGPVVYFAASGRQTIRIQTREDGFSIDQVLLSPATYLARPPGALKNDTTIVPLPGAGTTPSAPSEVIVYASTVPASGIHGGWMLVPDSTAANGIALGNADLGAPKIAAPLASPSSYVDVAFEAQAGVAYHVWLRMRAQGDSFANDSVYVQFSGAVDQSGQPLDRLGTAAGEAVVLQDSTGAPLAGWGWNDTGWASLGASIYFAETGTQTLRIQQREDGILIDQIVISPSRYLTTSPGALTNDQTIVK